MPADLYLVRHGDTTLNDQGVFRSHLNPPLNATGKADADKLAYYFSSQDVGHIVSSPMRRAMETATMIAGRTGAPVQASRFWSPWHLGDWAGQQSAPLVPKMLEKIKTDEPPPGGEPFSIFQARVAKGLRQAMQQAEGSDRDVVVVTHVRNIRLAMDLMQHPDPKPDQLQHITAKADPVEPGGLLRLTLEPGGEWSHTVITLPTEEYAMAQGYGER